MRQILLTVLLLLFCQSTFAGDDPIVWEYSESWWQNSTPDQGVNCNTQDPNGLEETFVLCQNDPRFTFITRETAELNPEANAHGIEIKVQIKDLYDNQIVSEQITSEFYAGTQTIFTAQTEHEVISTIDGSGMGPFEGLMNIDVSCNGQMPGGGGSTGIGGFAFMSFRLLYIETRNRATYQHIHNPSYTCPCRCRDSVAWAAIFYYGTPAQYAIVTVPFTIFGCSPIGGGASLPYAFACFDRWA